ncbi:hypothetical protein Neosp_012081 [[Neocosmospora] mangrovei]
MSFSARGPGPHDRLELNTPEEVWLEPLSNIFNAPYWTRLWIGQEFILGGDPILFFGNFQTGAHKIALFIGSADGTENLHDLPGWRYFWWRYMRFENRHSGKRPKDESLSLASLLRAFAESNCQDKRDRVYGLLSLADDADPALVDYKDKVKVDDVFRNTMTLMMRQRRPLDELLLIGEALIESLELWPATDLPSTDLSSSPLNIKFDDTEDITMPTWSHATLETWKGPQTVETLKEDLKTVHETIQATCMYVGIRDGPDLHVFEYAVEKVAESRDRSDLQYSVAKKANRPIVKYCRAHEYLRGRSPACIGPISQKGLAFFWLESLPSEEVHYFSNPRAGRVALRSWRARDFQFSGELADEPAQYPDRLILPARRIVDSRRSSENGAWSGYTTPRSASLFATVDPDLIQQSQEDQLDAQPPLLAHGPRSTTMWLEDNRAAYKSEMAEYSDSEQFEEDTHASEEEWGGKGMK